jgi:type I restriction enzyme S subunit
MNAERLLVHYERIADAPDAIARLRRLILDLAVRGKLVPQDPNDEPAVELLKRLKKARSDMEAAGTIRKERSEAPSHYGGEQVFALPDTWSWARLTEIGQTQTGTSPSSGNPDLFGDFISFIKPADLDGNQINYDGPGLSEIGIEHSRLAAPNSILMVCIGATLGKVNTTSRAVCFNQQINSLTPFLDGLTAYIALALKASDFQSLAWSKAGTGTLPIISKGKWEVLPIPLPPLAEQQRIVAKVDELMSLCDRLEAARIAREATRDRLAAASLARLNAPDPDTFLADARFALGALPALTSRPDQIKQIRQTILNLAVRGKLGGKADGDFKPVGAYRSLQNGYAFKSGWFSKTGIRLLRNANIGHGTIRWDETVFLPPERENEFQRFLLSEGDIVLTLDRPFIVTGTKVARVAAGDVPSLLLQRVGRFVERASGLSDDYFFMWINSPHFNEQIDPGRSNGVPHISSKQVEAAKIFVPPLSEQHRIVAKVDELMALCDRLEASLASASATRRRLLEALLAEVLQPDEQRELEAAE